MTAAVIFGCGARDASYYQGYIEGEYVYLASSGQGVIKNLFVTKGQTVRQNEALFQLDPNPEAMEIEEMRHRIEQAKSRMADEKKGDRPSELANVKARLAKARSALALAKRDLLRRQKLFELGSTDTISEEELDRFQTEVHIKQTDVDTIEAELKTARLGGRVDAVVATEKEINILDASLKRLKWLLKEKQVKSPAAGTIQDVLYRAGEFVPSGRPVISLLPPENLRIRFFVPQSHLPDIRVGSTVRVRLDGAASRIRASVSFISPESEYTPPVIYSRESRTKLVFLIEAVPEVNEMGPLRVGQPVEVYLDG